MWNIQRVVSKGDYNYAVVPEHPKATKNGYVLEHRVVMENVLDRILEDFEDIHHINENKKDNDPSNLEIKIHGEHQRHHALLRGKTVVQLVCNGCGCTFEKQKSKIKYDKNYCSRSCYHKYNKPPINHKQNCPCIGPAF